MRIKQVAKTEGGQDGAIYGSELFRFSSKGDCSVYDLTGIDGKDVCELSPIASFKLDLSDVIAPHSNAVCFGCEFYDEEDKYPLLYTNIYNNYANEEDKLIGVCCVYRIQRDKNEFKSTLVQLIQIGFCDNPELWQAYPDKHCDRPYGNFVVDNDTRSYYAFVMRNEELGTRYFKFDLPSCKEGELDLRFGVKKVVLGAEDIKEYFDTAYHRYIQGAIFHGGKIYSTEGFQNDETNRPAIRIIDTRTKAEVYIDLMDMGYLREPEFIDFYNGDCYYSDAHGNLYYIDFDA